MGWFWAGWQYWKKMGPIMSNFWEEFFYVFMAKKNFKNLLKIVWKKLHKMKLKKVNHNLLFSNSIMTFKQELSPQNGRYTPLLHFIWTISCKEIFSNCWSWEMFTKVGRKSFCSGALVFFPIVLKVSKSQKQFMACSL